MNEMTQIIQQLEARLVALREVGGRSGTEIEVDGNKRSMAQKARWAAVGEGSAAKKMGGGLTPEGRKRLAENMRKRWAAKRTAAQAKKRKKAA
jgi:hypothetical protein